MSCLSGQEPPEYVGWPAGGDWLMTQVTYGILMRYLLQRCEGLKDYILKIRLILCKDVSRWGLVVTLITLNSFSPTGCMRSGGHGGIRAENQSVPRVQGSQPDQGQPGGELPEDEPSDGALDLLALVGLASFSISPDCCHFGL